MSTVIASVDVGVPVRTAYNQWTQFESFPLFMSGVESIKQVDDRHLHWSTKVGGVRREFDTEIVVQQPDERIAWRSTGGDVRHAGVVPFDQIGAEATRVTIQLEWEPSGMVEQAGSALGLDSHQVRADTDRFKKFIEDRRQETGGWRGTITPRQPM